MSITSVFAIGPFVPCIPLCKILNTPVMLIRLVKQNDGTWVEKHQRFYSKFANVFFLFLSRFYVFNVFLLFLLGRFLYIYGSISHSRDHCLPRLASLRRRRRRLIIIIAQQRALPFCLTFFITCFSGSVYCVILRHCSGHM